MHADLPALREWISEHTHATVYEDFYSPLCYIATDNQESDAIQQHLENPLAQAILAGDYLPGDTIGVTVSDGVLNFAKAGALAA